MKTKRTLEEQKQTLKEKMNNEIDKFYEQFQQTDRNINIDTVERIMLEGKEKMNGLINEATPEIVETGQIGSKKNNVHNVKG